jgi:hypothetical protein
MKVGRAYTVTSAGYAMACCGEKGLKSIPLERPFQQEPQFFIGNVEKSRQRRSRPFAVLTY